MRARRHPRNRNRSREERCPASRERRPPAVTDVAHCDGDEISVEANGDTARSVCCGGGEEKGFGVLLPSGLWPSSDAGIGCRVPLRGRPSRKAYSIRLFVAAEQVLALDAVGVVGVLESLPPGERLGADPFKCAISGRSAGVGLVSGIVADRIIP